MAKTIKKTSAKQEDAKRAWAGARIAKMFSLPRPGHGNPPHRFSRDNQPAKRGRPPGAPNLLTKEIKTAAVDAATRYGCDGRGTGGLEGFFYRACDLHAQTMIALLSRIVPLQKSPDGERQKTVYR